MKCPYCNCTDSKVVDSRPKGESISRRRECLECGQRFNTNERLQSEVLTVIKRSGGRQDFSSEKLLAGLRKACGKRPLPPGVVEQLAREVETELRRSYQEVPSEEIGRVLISGLRGVDKAACARYVSVHLGLTATEFLEVLEQLNEDDGTPPPGQQSLFAEDEMEHLTRRVVQFSKRRQGTKRSRSER